MENRANGAPPSGVRATLQRVWTASQVVARESIKPQPIPLEAYLLPQHMHHNRAEIQKGEQCGCVCCEQIFSQKEIRKWVGGGTTAVCPRCNTAAIVGAGAGFKLTPQLLRRAHQMLFEGKGRRV